MTPNPQDVKYLRNKFYNIKSRCYNKKDWNYKKYGKRGITICEEWLKNTYSFVVWAFENGWQKGLTIERINVHEGYSPQNCTWISPEEQYWNRTDTVTNRENKTRICQKCKEEKPLSMFHKNKSKPLGHHYICKKCRNSNQ